ncbi:MAG: AzlC family ABC transporter permease [Bacteroides sp.]|nr:AzlC family ABC transporter permease [Prevotella sp.]MCM1407716.1 AzlC family ABC transporter permease [Treponema brennaborense]MCM1469134.1 AzlC family ABC transporter permease [Bacteroides sp.]
MNYTHTQRTICEDSFSNGIRNGLPVCFGYLPVAFAFGIFAVGQGFAVWQAVAVSMANFTSAGQLAGVPIIAGALPVSEMALSQLVINMRYALMSVSLSQKLDKNVTVADRFLISFTNTDEIFAIASGHAGTVGRHYLFGLAVTPYIGWTLGTVLGAAAGNILPEILTNALGIAIYGMFIAIVLPPAKKSRPVAGTLLLSIAVSIALRYAPFAKNISAGFVIIICALTSSALFALLCPVREEEQS